MIDDLKDDLKSILNDLEKINKISEVGQIISKIQDFYKKLIIFQFKKENENILDGSDQKGVDTAMETINDIVAEIPDQTNTSA